MQVESKVKERPILFSAPMVRAILEGRKTQTRRVMKPQPIYRKGRQLQWSFEAGSDRRRWRDGADVNDHCLHCSFWGKHCPYGSFGERLWVRERWRPTIDSQSYACIQYLDESIRLQLNDNNGEGDPIGTREHKQPLQRVGKDGPAWKPSIHMPRWASRITLEITGVRVERLQDISEKDALNEGVFACEADGSVTSIDGRNWFPTRPDEATLAFRELWNSINGPDSWAANPWVWVVEFRNVRKWANERTR